MNVREALETLLFQEIYHSDGYDDDARLLAPGIERALRAAYWEGAADVLEKGRNGNRFSDDGVTAGVAAMVEGP